MSIVLWTIGLILSCVGGLALLSVPEKASGWAPFSLGAGIFCVVAAYFTGRDRAAKGNIIKLSVFVASAAATFVGFLFILFSSGSDKAQLSYVLGGAGILLGGAGMFYAYRFHQNEALVGIGKEIGFEPAESGLFGKDGRYDIKGVMHGVEVYMDGSETPASRYHPHSVTLEIKCLIGNSGDIRVAAYPEGQRPVASLPAKVEDIPYWDYYCIHSEPPGVAGELLSPLRKAGNSVFSDDYGFIFLEVKGQEMVCRFRLEGYFSKEFVGETAWQAAWVASHIT